MDAKSKNDLNKIGGGKLADDDGTNNAQTANASIAFESMSKLNAGVEQATITIKERDIETLKSELDITQQEAKSLLIKNNGDLHKALTSFIVDFKTIQI